MLNIVEMSRFLIIDDHPLFREALHSAVDMVYPDSETVEAASLGEANALLDTNANAYDLALLDLNIPDTKGFEGLIALRARFPRLPIVVVSGHEDARIIREVISYGAAGFIPKSIRKTELGAAIKAVMEGEVYLPPSYEEPPLEDDDDRQRRAMIERLSTLTPQQLRVLQMLRDGLLNKQIAFELQVGETTVKAHVSEILRKLNVYSRTQAVIEVSKLDGADLMALQNEGLTRQPKN